MFRNAWNLGSISGIKIQLHWTFLLLPIFIYSSAILDGRGVAAAASMVALVLAVFGCVLLHELGHAFAARQFGIGTRDIILLPIGGVASLERMPENPFHELWIAVAGPLVNVVIAIALFFGIMYSPIPISNFASEFLTQLAIINIALVVFNMIPAFPMDGGRVLRSIMAMFLPYVQATTIAATVGKYCAIALALFGLFSGQFMLILLAGFVFFAGQTEKMAVVQRHRYQQHPFGGQFRSGQSPANAPGPFQDNFGQNEISVPSSLSGDSVAAWLGNMRAEYCSVVDSGRVIGRLTKAQLLSALSQGLGNMPIGQILMQKQY